MFYLCILILMIWLILKVAGVIQTPAWLEYGLPIGSAIIGFLMFYQSLIDKIFGIYLKIGMLHANDVRFEEKFSHIEKELGHLDQDMETVKKALHAHTAS